MNLTELKALWTSTMAQAEEIRQKYAGKPQDMPGDEQERWEKALEDAEKLQRQIELAEREQKSKDFGNALSEQTKGIVAAVSQVAEKSDVSPDQKLQMQAFGKYLRDGEKSLTPEEYKALSAATATAGGYLVAPISWMTGWLEALKVQTFIRGIARVLPPINDTQTVGSPTLDSDDLDPSWTGEGTAITYGDIVTGKRELHPHLLQKAVKISKRLMQLTSDPSAIAMDRLSYKHAYAQENAFLNGTGALQPLGVFTAHADGVSTSRDTTTGTSLTIGADDVMELFYSLRPGYRPRSTWVLSKDALKDLRKLKDSANNYIWQPFDMPGRQLVGGLPGSILGQPYVESELATNKTASVWVAADYPIVVGDFSYYWIQDSFSFEIFVNPYTFSANNQTAYEGRGWTDAMPVLGEAFSRLKMKA